jgi:hypothetical protein
MATPILGMVRSVVKEDSYAGYRIPKGATVMMNVWYVFFNLLLAFAYMPSTSRGILIIF